MTEESSKAEYRTLSDILDMSAKEGAPIVARIAPAIDEIATKTGILKLVFNNTVAIANNPRAMARMSAKEQAKIKAQMAGIGESVLSALMQSMGTCMPQYVEVLAAINGMTARELEERCTMRELVDMVKALVSDAAFLDSVQTLTR